MRFSIAFFCFLSVPYATAQDRGMLFPLSLGSLEAFHPTGANWQLVSGVESNRLQRWSLTAAPGAGVLVNAPGQGPNSHIFTAWMHGDLELALEFMMPKGSNSGIYLQGRYEVQLLDSWGRRNPGFADLGGIYQRWNEIEGKGFEGHPPRTDASRAPGLWQTLHLIFRAPRFDNEGRKVRHARFERVVINGAVLHEDVEVTGPTRAAAFDDEQPLGPLMIQGDHGPVAVRNIRFKRYGPVPVSTSEVAYRMYVGDFTAVPRMEVPARQGHIEHLGALSIDETKPLLVAYEGQITLPATGQYRFNLALDWITGDPHFRDNRIGGAQLTIGERQILRHDINATQVQGIAYLEKGKHAFSLLVHKAIGWRPPGIALEVEGPDTPLQSLMQASRRGPPVAPIPVTAGHSPTVLRGFMLHGDSKRTHAVSVGDPSGVHYSVDLQTAGVLYAWRGPFLDATAMWHNRGHDQLMRPQGSVLTLPGHLPIVQPGSSDSLRTLGYRLDPEGRPVFRYAFGALLVEDLLLPAEAGPYLQRTLSFSTDTVPPEELWIRAVHGPSIRKVEEGIFEVDDRSWYIEVLESGQVQHTEEGDALMIPVRFEGGEARVTYGIVW